MIKNFFFVFLVAVLPITGFAQFSVYNEIWVEAGGQAKIVKKLNLSFAEGLRLQEGSMGQTYTQLELGYKINKYISVEGGYRFIQKPAFFSILDYDHRFAVSVSLSYKTGKFTFGFRPRFQHRIRGIYADDGKRSKTYNRNKLSLKYDINDYMALTMSYEFFYRLSGMGNFIDQNRYKLEGSYKISKKHTVGAFYMMQRETQVYLPELTHVAGLNYNYKF